MSNQDPLEVKIESLKELLEIKTKHIEETIELRGKMSEIAINKSETSMLERMESSNNKFALLKEQAAGFATKTDIGALETKVSLLAKFIYMGIGGLIVLEVISKFIFK